MISPRHRSAAADNVVYRILRPTTGSDEQLVERLERYKCDAIDSCRQRLSQSASQTTLLDVDQLLDGGTLVMHFLGDVDSVAQEIASEIADTYESVVRTNHLSELLTDGCGPECGTASSSQCAGSCAGCSTCSHRY